MGKLIEETNFREAIALSWIEISGNSEFCDRTCMIWLFYRR
ncbi:hypothetical protein [Moorena sp. SIO3B2]|nr:hypothetical protein [Moorena sp. SIO3B2]